MTVWIVYDSLTEHIIGAYAIESDARCACAKRCEKHEYPSKLWPRVWYAEYEVQEHVCEEAV